MKSLFSFILGLAIGAAAHWYLTQPDRKTTVNGAGTEPRATATEVKDTLKDKVDTEKIKDELNKTGKVIREKTRQAGQAIVDATANASTTAAIKAKLVQDSGLAALKIDVDTTDGVVTLSGSVHSYEQIDRAMDLALNTDGVTKVISTLLVKSKS
jgi:hyperosmotically inducible periplasmic protein